MFKRFVIYFVSEVLCTNTTISIECKRVTGQESGEILNNEMAVLYRLFKIK